MTHEGTIQELLTLARITYGGYKHCARIAYTGEDHIDLSHKGVVSTVQEIAYKVGRKVRIT